jgi:hypothetical protein
MSAVSSADHSCFDSEFARAISRRFEHSRFLIVGANAQNLQCQLAEAGREADAWSHGELASKLSHDTGKARFKTRPQLVACFGRFRFVPDYECD